MPLTATINRGELRTSLNEARRLRKDAEQLVKGLRAAEDKFRQDAENSFPADAFGTANDRREAIKRFVAQKMTGPREHATETLKGYYHQVSTLRDIAEAGRGIYDNRRALVDLATVADPKRATYSANLAGLGRAGLENLARHAVATSDLALAAAVATSIDALPSDARPFQSVEMLNAIQHDDVDGPMNEYRELVATAENSLTLLRDAEGRADAATGKIARGLRDRDAVYASELADDAPGAA